jgi:hypothetical protein
MRPYITNKNSVTNASTPPRITALSAPIKGLTRHRLRKRQRSQISYSFGGAASSGSAGLLGVWNMYNRVTVASNVQDTTASWRCSTNTWPGADGLSTIRTSYVVGLAEDAISANYNAAFSDTAGAVCASGIGVDATSAFSGKYRSLY